MISILIVDDHPLLRQGLKQLLSLAPEFRLAGECGNGQEAVKLAIELQPDLILLDLNMPDMDGEDTVRAIRAADIESRIAILTVSDADRDLQRVLQAGVSGYLLKDMDPELLITELRSLAAGEVVIAERLKVVAESKYRALDIGQSSEQRGALGEELTPRELDIVKCLAQGYSNKRISQALGISEGTVKVHVKNLLKKLNVHSRMEAALIFMERNEQDMLPVFN